MSANEASESKTSFDYEQVINLKTPVMSQRGVESVSIQKMRRKSHLITKSDQNFINSDMPSSNSKLK